MRKVLVAAAALLLPVLPAHSQLQPVQPQQPIYGGGGGYDTQPRLGDTQDCHAEAQRQAQAQYPPQRIFNRGRETTFENPGQFSAETSIYQDCMRRKGF
jgi:hypothetical protein